MEAQTQIKRRLSEPGVIGVIQEWLAGAEVEHRTDLARRVCERYGLRDARGRPQMGGCLKALRELERAGSIELPAARTRPGRGQARRLTQAVPMPEDLPSRVEQVRDLELVLVQSQDQMRLWNELMLREHPRGAGPLVGAQLRYLVASAHGWLGGISFSAAALQLQARDAWLGWDAQQRRTHLHRVVNLSRFLIRTRGCCNLASCVLGLVLRRVADDFAQGFGYRPWLVESFVDTEAFEGTCYRASNWVEVGQTQGRGRQDRAHARSAGSKAIYVYPLVEDLRAQLGVAPVAPLPPLAAGEGLDGASWAEQEFGGAQLGDARLSRRLVMSAQRQAEQPGRAFTGVAQGDWPAIRGYYRLIDHPDTEAVTMAAILRPHREQTLRRMQNESHVLCIQDGTQLNYGGLDKCAGLGVIGTNQTGAQSRGMHLHSMLAVSASGIPLGVVDARCRNSEPAAPPAMAETAEPQKKTTEEKKTFEWIAALHECMAMAQQLPQTRITCVMDREADFAELFEAHRQNPCVELLVRAKHNRVLAKAPRAQRPDPSAKTPSAHKLFERLRSSPARGDKVQLTLTRQSARRKRSKQQARPARAGRVAELTLRYEPIEFRSERKDQPPISLWAVHAVEQAPPADAVRPVEWLLLTSRIIDTPAAAEQCLKDYALRWRIEDWHRVLKSGCAVEDLAHESVERIQRALAINLVIGWRIMLMTLLGREVPELPADILFSDLEIQFLRALAKALPHRRPPTQLGEAIRMVAQLGGYVGRGKDPPPPGHQLMWEGLRKFTAMCEGYALAKAELNPT